MGSRHTGMRGPRRAGLALEPLEGRDLPTSPTLLAGPMGVVGRASARPTATDVASLPTPHEAAREQFVAKFSGPFIVGPGRFTDQAGQVYIQGGGTSNMALHVDLQLGAFTPVDPNGNTTGQAALIVKNVSNSGNLLALDLVGDPTSIDRAGRPTRFTWTVGGSSGGTFSGATGEGTVEIHYWPGHNRLVSRARAGGQAGVIFRGRVETSGVSNVLRS